MTNKLTEKISQNPKVDGKKRKIDNFDINQDLSIYHSLSKKPRKELNQKTADINYEEKLFKCDKCDKNFGKNCNLKTHIKSVHGEKIFKCNICPSSFTKKKQLEKAY